MAKPMSVDDKATVTLAKTLMMQVHGISEYAAYSSLRTRAMNQRVTIAQVAKDVIKTYAQAT